MKRIELENHGTLYIGQATEISRLYRNLKVRQIAHRNFCEDPIFNFSKYYGLVISKYDLDGHEEEECTMLVVAGDTALAMIYDL